MPKLEPGDICLSGLRAQALVSIAIKLGSVLRHEPKAARVAEGLATLPVLALIGAVLLGAPWRLAALLTLGAVILWIALGVLVAVVYGRRGRWFSHSFIVNRVDEHEKVWITEAQSRGVVTLRMHYAPGDYVVLKTSSRLSGDDVAQMQLFLDTVVAARWRYDYWTFAGLAVYCLTGAFLAPPHIGTALCSGVTSEATTRGWLIWPLTAYRMMPQDQYAHAQREGIEIVATG
jgi:hypothetical protein